MSAPNSKQRQICWEARDKLWDCLDHNQDNMNTCKKYQIVFEATCPAQWVKYFNKRRDFMKYREKIETEGFEPAQDTPK